MKPKAVAVIASFLLARMKPSSIGQICRTIATMGEARSHMEEPYATIDSSGGEARSAGFENSIMRALDQLSGTGGIPPSVGCQLETDIELVVFRHEFHSV